MKKDTSPQMAQKYHKLIMGLSAEQRVKMGCRMFDCAREIMKAGLAIEPNPKNLSWRARIFHRLYKRDFSPQELDIITRKINSFPE